MRARCTARETDDCSSRLWLPVRCTKSRECCHEIHSIVGLETFRQSFSLRRTLDDLEPIAEPLHCCTGNEDRSLQRVRILTFGIACHSREDALTRLRLNLSGIEQEERAGPVRVLAFTGIYTRLTEQRRLLITGNTID